VSLVLEALKKLDREKGRPERGFVVMAATPWPARAVRRWPLGVAALALAVAGATWAVMWQRAPAPPVGGPASVVAPAAAAAPDVAAVPAARLTPARRPPERAPAVDSSGGGPAAAAPPVPATGVARPAPAPAASPAAAEHGLHGLRLQAISERDGKPVAIIDDRLVHVGDEFDGVRVLAIREAEVDVEVRGQRATLRF
jgi:hypothetical protein